MNNILVTGANGFVGRALCKKLMSERWRVKGSVRSTPSMSSLESGVNFINVGPIGPNTQWDTALNGIDTVVHLAARLNLNTDYAIDPTAACRSVNVSGTEGLARAAAHKNIRRFVYLSTVKVNGEGKQSPYTEADEPAPKEPYSSSKYEAEQILHEISNETGLETVILRPTLVYGPGVKANFCYLLKLVYKGIPLPFARVANRRSLIFLDNLICAILACIKHPDAAGQTYLVSDSEIVSTPELIRKIAETLGKSARLFSFPPNILRMIANLAGKSDKVKPLLNSLTVDTSKIRNNLNWKPICTQKEGLIQTARWFREEQNQ
jgi:nucleoside-diphosphate-sugar epimerase